jgi:hypothetical protein
MFIDRKVAGGAFLGILVAVGTMVGATALRQDRTTDAEAVSAVPGSRTLLTGADAVALGCQPNEAAVVQRFTFRGERGLNSECVVVSAPWAAATNAVASAPLAAPTVTAVRTSAVPAVRRARQSETAASSGRTWKKTALVIGGSTAAGAGIGGLIGGKKGALIGSAIGGGGSTIYEAMKRR